MPDQLTTLLLLTHAAATWFMVGLIWFVQLVHYPLMHHVPETHTRNYAAEHQSLTTRVVAPVMLVELAAVVWTFFCSHPDGEFSALRAVGAGLLALVWASTFLVQVPLHRTLLLSPNARTRSLLVRTNWIRTAAWTGRGVVALAMLRHSAP